MSDDRMMRAMTPQEIITEVLDTCTCTPPPYGEGPEEDCPKHGRPALQAHAIQTALRDNGYTLTRPTTEAEEKADQW